MSVKVSVHWNGLSHSGTQGDHVHQQHFPILPRVGDVIQVSSGQERTVTKVLYTNSEIILHTKRERKGAA